MHNHYCEAYVICGDFNTSFLRSNAQSNCLNAFIHANSCIDYFFVTENIFDLLNRCVVHYDPTNPSNHNVIELDYRCESQNIVIRDRCCASSQQPLYVLVDTEK